MKRKLFKEEKTSVPVSWVNTLSSTEFNSSSRGGKWRDPLLVRPTGTSAVRSMDGLLGFSSESEGHSVMSDSLRPHGLYSPGNSPAPNTWRVAFPFSRGSSQPRDWTHISRIAGKFFTSWATREAQEYWSGWPIPSPVTLPHPGIEPGSPALQVDSLLTELSGKPFWCKMF